MCRPQPLLCDKAYSSDAVMEYVASNTSPVTMLAELTTQQTTYVNQQFEKHVHLFIEQYNLMLESFLSESCCSKIVMIRIAVNHNTINSVMISMLGKDEIPFSDDVVQLSINVWRATLPNTKNRFVGVKHGVVIQHLCNCPFEKQLTSRFI